MTGWNLPPGVSPSDIPGNRPEDLALDHFQITHCVGDPEHCEECACGWQGHCDHPQHPDNLAQRSKYDEDERV